MIFQEPMTSLNPVFTVGFQIAEVLTEHLGMARGAALDRAAELMDEVGIPAARQRLGDYPHQLSGGMRQRVMIAMALACQPKLLIADEPTTALDVTIQAQILDLIRRLRDDHGTAVLLITHDMGVIAEMADQVVVMYAGEVVEQAPVEALFADPRHPYTRLLLRSVPRVKVRAERLRVIEGNIPSPAALPEGCRFHPRCPDAIERCRREPPALEPYDDARSVRCWRARESGLSSAQAV
jgi:oligopeptide/dipeptide ABC transporter ATP-binding protein